MAARNLRKSMKSKQKCNNNKTNNNNKKYLKLSEIEGESVMLRCLHNS